MAKSGGQWVYGRRAAGLAVVAALAGCAQADTPLEQAIERTIEARQPLAPNTVDDESLLRMGDFALGRGDTVTAVSFYRRAHFEDPEAIAPLMRMGSALAAAGAFVEAEGAYRAVMERRPEDALAARLTANTLLAQRRPAQALTLLARLDPADPAVANSRGVALDLLGRHDEAMASYRMGLQTRPNDLDLRSNLALSQVVAGETEAAVTALRAVAAAPAATRRHRQNLMIVLGLAGDRDAVQRLAQASRGQDDTARLLAHIDHVAGLDSSSDKARALMLGGLP